MEKDGRYSYMDISGHLISENFFSDVSDDGFSAIGLAAVKISGKWGYIDTKGHIVIQPQFDEANLFSIAVSLL